MCCAFSAEYFSDPSGLPPFEKIQDIVNSEFEIEESFVDHNIPTFYITYQKNSKKAFLKLIKLLESFALLPILRKKEEKDLEDVKWGVRDLLVERRLQRTTKSTTPRWFYICSIFAVFLFTAYISIYATIHFEKIGYMNIMIVFFFVAMISYFLISIIFFISEKKKSHSVSPTIFFIEPVGAVAGREQ